MSEISRRDALRYLVAGAIGIFSMGYSQFGFAQGDAGNFKHVYLDPKLRGEFFTFLKNVFHLYPEEDFHAFILR
jgi:hypothetical protein